MLFHPALNSSELLLLMFGRFCIDSTLNLPSFKYLCILLDHFDSISDVSNQFGSISLSFLVTFESRLFLLKVFYSVINRLR